jgi:competence protein ComEC
VILVLGIVVVAVSFISPVAWVLGILLEWSIRIVNWGVFAVEAIPYSLIDQVYITTAQCWLLIVAILCVFMLIAFRRFEFVISACVCIFLFSYIQWEHFTESVSQQKFTVYKITGQSAFDLFYDGKVSMFIDSALIQNEERMRFHVRPNRLQSGIGVVNKSTEAVKDFPGSRLIIFSGKRILHIYNKQFSFPQLMQTDYVLKCLFLIAVILITFQRN